MVSSASASIAPQVTQHATKVLLVMDVVESVRLMEEDEEDAVLRWQRCVGHVVQQVLPGHGGKLVKSLGDGLMLEFTNARQCVQAAFAIQQWNLSANAGLPGARQMQLRMGAHVADCLADEHDIYGVGVNLAVRLTALSQPGELIASTELREQLVPQLDADVEDLGDCFLKHINRPVRAYRIAPPSGRLVTPSVRAALMDLRPTIAVIPFSLRSAEPQLQMLGEALAEEVIAALSRTFELHVISRLSTTAFRDRHQALEEVHSHLGARYVLSGTCRSSELVK